MGFGIIAGLSLFCAALLAQPAGTAAIDAIVREALAASQAPGLAVAVVRGDQVVYLKGHGTRELGSSLPVTPDTVFAIGSLTKAFTTTAMAILIDEGKMAWDDPVRKHVPYFKLSDPLADSSVTLRDLVTHRTGLAGHDLLWMAAPWSLEETIRRVAFLKPSQPFRSAYQYHNIMYNAAGYAVGYAAKSSWQEVVENRIFKPLGMSGTVLTSGAAQQAPDHATPHRRGAAIPWYNDDRQIRPAGSIKSSAQDLTRWMRFQLGEGVFEGLRLVSAKNLQETRTPQIPIRSSEPDAPVSAYGMGWTLRDYHGRLLVSHGGAVVGFRAALGLIPKEKLGVVALTNFDEAWVQESVVRGILDYLLQAPPKDWNAEFGGLARRAQEREQARLREREVKRQKDPARPLETYAGTYLEPAYGPARVAVEDGGLVLRWSSFRLPLRHFHHDTFDITGEWRMENQAAEFAGPSLKMLGVEFRRVDYERMAERITAAVKPRPGERVVMRVDPDYFADLVDPLRKRIPQARVLAAREPVTADLLASTDVYLWLPLGKTARELSPAERQTLARWLDQGGARREIHFHWADGSRAPDGLAGEHTFALDEVYERALDIDYRALDAAQERAMAILRRGTVRVHTPAGTDLMFRVGLRPFNKQNGDASPERMQSARVRVDREIELPAGVLRVAPVEESASGVIVLPEARFGNVVARKVALQFDNGRITRVRAEEGQEAVEAALSAGGEAARRFREFGLGFNPKLPGLGYFAYGAGAVRLSLGDNEELGGKVRGGFSRWFFFPDASVHVNGRYLVRDGKLLP